MCSVSRPASKAATADDAHRVAEEITELAAHISAATCRWLSLIADFDETEAYTWFGFPACADWLAWSCGISGPTAREHVRVARTLRDLGCVRDCFARGELSYSKVRALSRVATAENEDYLLMLARHCTAAQLERVVRNYRRCTAADLDETNAVHANRYLSWSWDDDGCLNIRGQLSPEEGQVVVQALEAGVEALRAQAPTPDGQSDVSAETESADATHADALALMAETLLAGGPKHRGRAARTEVVVHVDADTLAGTSTRTDDDAGICHIEDAVGLHPETARRLGCDASLLRIIEREGRPLTIGRKRRTIPPPLRRALQARDQGCRYPGCNRRGAWVDGHHVTHWAHGGKTELENLVQLCGLCRRRHNRHSADLRVMPTSLANSAVSAAVSLGWSA